MIKLYGVLTSPYVRHARVALTQSDLDWKLETITPKTIKRSPTMRVPFLEDGDLMLTDSAVIVRYVREQTGQPYLETLADHELFALATSVLDTAVNVYLMNIDDSTELDSVERGSSTTEFNAKQYFERQQQRINTGLMGLNELTLSTEQPYTDGEIRLGSLLDWGEFRGMVNLDELPALQHFLKNIRTWSPFVETAPDQ